MEFKSYYLGNFHINKLPYMQNNNDNFFYKRNTSKKISEKHNLKKIGDSFNQKTNYRFNICPLGSSTLEINKNNSNLYQIKNLTNEKSLEKENSIVNKTNLKLKNKVDKNISFVSKNKKRETSFNKNDITTNLLKHMSLKSKNKNIDGKNTNIYYKQIESSSTYALLDSNKRNYKDFSVGPSFLQYDFEKIKLINKENFMNFIKNQKKAGNNKENSKNNIYKENLNTNVIKLKNKEIIDNNSNNLYLKLNNNIMKNISSNRHNIKIKLQKKENNNNNNEYFNEKEEKEITLTKDEKLIYGNRNMRNYIKIKLLGKGGCGIVWLCYKNINKDNVDIEEYAVKQITKKAGNNQSLLYLNLEENIKIARNEIKMLKYLNANEQDINEIIPKFYEYYEDNNDIWFSFEKGGNSLSSLSFKIKGEFENRERIYNIQKGIFLKYLFSNISQFKLFIRKILSGIDFINSKGIIHSDIKPENILIEYSAKDDNFEINKIKIIDYGSSFNYNQILNINSNTPEYLCPEITIGNKNFLKNLSESKKYINCIDIWSFGITLLELCLCCPIWMSYKCKICLNERYYYSIGYFGCKGRDGNKIYQKQIDLSKNLHKILRNSLLYMMDKNEKEMFVDLLGKMLEFNYKNRINIKDALNHPFLKN